MYGTCLFCSASLGTNEAIETFPVGRSIAFDAWQGRQIADSLTAPPQLSSRSRS
jgi:hypothetical protein